MTDAGSISWLYAYQQDNNDDNLPRIEAFAASHEPSPWMGDRQTFQVMPSPATGVPNADRDDRALTFKHANEIAKPLPLRREVRERHAHRHRADRPRRAVPLRVHRRRGQRDPRQRRPGRGRLRSHDQRRPRARSAAGPTSRSGLSNGAGRLFVYGTFDKPVTQSGKLNAGDRDSTGYVKFDTSSDKVVNLRIATSLMSIEQAKKNLQLEIRPTDTLTSLAARAQSQWDDKLDAVEVEGATAGPEPDALLEPLPAVAVSELGARERRHRRLPDVEAHGAVLDRLAAGHARPRPAATSSTARCTSTTASGTRTGPSGRAYAMFDPAHGRRADRRLRPAVPRRRLDRALVLAGLREPHDRHELGRRVRRRLREGGQGLQRPRRLRRRGPERHRGAAGRRPERPERRPQGPGDVAVPRLHAVGGVRGRLVGARGLHQRLRHRQHGEGAGRPSERRRQAASARGVRVLPQPRHATT